MEKQIIICCNRTWNSPDKIKRKIKSTNHEKENMFLIQRYC